MANVPTILDTVPGTLVDLSASQLHDLLELFVDAWQHRDERPLELNDEEFLNRLLFVIVEFRRRPGTVPALPEDLAAAIQALENPRRQTMSDDAPHAIDEASCMGLLEKLPYEIEVLPDVVRFGGRLLQEGDTHEDDPAVEVFLRDGFPDSSRDLKLFRLAAAVLGRPVKITLCPDGFPENMSLQEGYDLVLRRRADFDLHIVNEPDFQRRIYEGECSEILSETVADRRIHLREGLVDFVTIPGFVSVTGSYIYHRAGRTPNDVDVIVKSFDEREDIREALETVIREATGSQPHFVWEPRGPNWSFFPVYDLVFRARSPRQTEARQIRARALKVPDPEFLLQRVADSKEALLLSAVDRKSLVGTPFLLVNERIKPDEPVRAFAVVEFTQEPETVSSLRALGDRAQGLDSISRREFGARGEKSEGPFYVLRLSVIERLDEPVPLKQPPPGRRFGSEVDLERDRLQEAFHLRDIHWVPVPSSGTCPMTHPSKLKFPGTDTLRCFTPSAARVVRGRMREQIEKIDASEVNLRPKDFPTMSCAMCRYFIKGTDPSEACKIVTRAEPELVCDAYQGLDPRAPTYEVSDKDWLSFVDGMVKEQPYQHIVQRGFLTPEGPIVIIADTMKPKPHIFSLSKKFHLEHTGVEHGWTQEEADALINVGRRESVAVAHESEETIQEDVRPLFGSPQVEGFQEAKREGVGITATCAGAELQFRMREISLSRACELAHSLCDANPETAFVVFADEFSAKFGPRREARRSTYSRLRGAQVGELFTNSRGLVANIRSIDLREVSPVDDERWAVGIERRNQHAGFLHLPDSSFSEAESFVSQLAGSNRDLVFHLGKAMGRTKAGDLIFRTAALMKADDFGIICSNG